MKFSKVLILAITLILAVGIVAAADLNDLKAPSNFKFDGNSSFYQTNILGLEEEDGISIEVITKENIEDEIASLPDSDASNFEEFIGQIYKNNTDLKYSLEPTSDENIFFYEDGINEVKGHTELVKIGDEVCAIESTIDSNASDDKINQSLEAIKELNKLNNFEPLDYSSYVN